MIELVSPEYRIKCHIHGKEMPCQDCIVEENHRAEVEQEIQREIKEKKLKQQRENPEPWLQACNIAKKHLSFSFDTFHGDAIKKACREAADNRQSVFITGTTGCGKTHLAVAMARHVIQTCEEPLPEWYWDGAPYLFVTVPELLLEIRGTFAEKAKKTEAEIIAKYAGVDLLILDDLGSEKPTEFAETTLYLIIDRRNRDDKWTVITSNHTLDEIEKKLGARIGSRLADMRVIKINLPDWRKKR